MIEQMQRLSLLLFYTEKKKALRALQNLGIVDLDLVANESLRARRSKEEREEITRMLQQIESARKTVSQSAVLPELALPTELSGQLKLIRSLLAEKDHLQNALRELRQEFVRYEDWGEIPVARIADLTQRGIGVHLFSGSVKFFDQYDFGEQYIVVVERSGNTVRFILVTLRADAPVIPFQKYPVPARGLAEMQNELKYLAAKLQIANERIAALGNCVHELRRSRQHINSRIAFEQAKRSLGNDKTGTVFGITGYFPESRRQGVINFLERRKLAYEITTPAADEPVPVLLRNNPLARLFEPITRIFSLPQYGELDPTPFFAPFFTVFFGFCMGDVGYGAVMLVVSGILFSRRNLRGIALLGFILSAATIASGLLMNSFFGSNLFVREGRGILQTTSDPAFFAAYTIKGKTTFPAMTLSLFVGCVQIFVAFILQSVNEILVLGKRYAFKALAMLMLAAGAFILGAHADFMRLGFNHAFVIGPLQIGKILIAVPLQVAQAMLVIGGILFFIFGNPDRKLWLRPLGGVWDFYQFSTGLLGDFLSYIRLFALALAGGLLGNAFNEIALMVLPKTPAGIDYASPWIVATLLILITGHTLNFGLALLGAFVHPLRLTFVEFYKNINFRGGGRVYRPFKRAASAT